MLDAVRFFETFSSQEGVADDLELVAPGDNRGCRTSIENASPGEVKAPLF